MPSVDKAVGGIPGPSLIEGVRFTQTVVIPNVLQGLFRRRPKAVAVANRLGVDKQVVGLIRGLRRQHGETAVWVRVVKERTLLVHSERDIRTVLGRSPEDFASDPPAKRKGMAHFQPHALTISRGSTWAERRRFTEAVLESGEPVHSLGDDLLAVADEEVRAMLAHTGAELAWPDWYAMWRRLTRRIVLGDGAREDEAISDLLTGLMDEANGLPAKQSEDLDRLSGRLAAYVEAAEPGSLVARFADAPQTTRTEPAGQLQHWLFAFHETLSANAFRALALLASHPAQRALAEEELAGAELDSSQSVASLRYLGGCLQEAMRLWVTTPILGRETVRPVELGGETIQPGTQVMIVNLGGHRDPDRVAFADRFAPEQWVDGDAGDSWLFNHLSHGPQGCPGAGLVMLLGAAVLARMLCHAEPGLLSPCLDPNRALPLSLDVFPMRFGLRPKPVR